MSSRTSIVSATRRALESAFGLALDGLSEDQIASAVGAALAREPCPVDGADARYLASVIDHLPIDESWLFRDEDLWRWVRDEVGPALLEQALARRRPIRALSIGCASGQEAYSLAIVLQGLLEAAGVAPSGAASLVQIDGIDPSPARVAAARAGVLNAWSVERCRPDWLRGRVKLEDPGRFRVDPSVLSMCNFETGNLVEVAGRDGALSGYDLVLCRHVLIYFEAERAARLVEQLGQGLDRGALLVVAAAEAHLLDRAGLGPDAHLGAGRRGAPAAAVAAPAPPERRRQRLRGPWASIARRPTSGPQPAPAPLPGPVDPASQHLRRALEHSEAGRGHEALREARAACFHDPRHLFSRMLLGRTLIAHDRERGREVLRAVLHHAAQLPQEAEVPSAPGLSVGQLASAVRLLLDRPGER
jgi:chemotaxis methyl-accepting protein methylase